MKDALTMKNIVSKFSSLLLIPFAFLTCLVATCTSCSRYAVTKAEDSVTETVDSNVAKSVFKVSISKIIDTSFIPSELGLGKTKDIGFMGTAFVVANKDGYSYLLTAGHICDDSTLYDTETIFGKLPVISTSYTLKDADDNLLTDVKVVLDDDNIDLCMLRVRTNIPEQPIKIADNDPPYAAHIHYIGAPKGHFGGGVTPIFEGLFIGRGELFSGDIECLNFTVTGAPGASGSPMLYNGKAVGVLTIVSKDFYTEVGAVPHEIVSQFIKRALN